MFAQGFQIAGILGLSGQETLIILGVAVLLFGGKKIPELAKGMGEGIKNFKAAMKEEDTPAARDASAAKKDEAEEVKK